MSDGVEMVGWVMLEDAALNPVVGFQSGADGGRGGMHGKDGAIDDDGKVGVGDMGCRLAKPVCFRPRCHIHRIPGSGC